MITLNLLHPIEAIPIQTWKFKSEPVIRIGRSGDNDVILYSSVVSRYHVELRRHSLHWEIVNIGANGTYINDQQIETERVQDGITIRLATTGPKLQILLDGAEAMTPSPRDAATKPLSPNKPADGRPTFMSKK
ncbi:MULTISPECIES: FHA domain-containing protein [Pseudanabaena]|uniref:Forkhead-associated protein n=2 Tax=Pseudanabaena TaxID=1152 RepID=L8MXC3_9CYAN|nr:MULTISPECIES: FHA domain-containing protein [Pseudanabaena]ELS32642.1 Forkhead-associated protein [Pseudanabaena biceps PCC 7429]MDG3495136.1 FHA domain-containing protein [Pseudanabaena catenata USMAC16]TYQ31983.1 FHA domain-containing protein [Pseudanabaena sp. UWO310]